MAADPAELRMVEDHIAQGRRHVSRQEELLAWLESRKLPTEMAKDLLDEFRATLNQHLQHRDKILRPDVPDPLDVTNAPKSPSKGR